MVLVWQGQTQPHWGVCRVTPAFCSPQVARAAFQHQVSSHSIVLTHGGYMALGHFHYKVFSSEENKRGGDLRPVEMWLANSKRHPDRLQATLRLLTIRKSFLCLIPTVCGHWPSTFFQGPRGTWGTMAVSCPCSVKHPLSSQRTAGPSGRC